MDKTLKYQQVLIEILTAYHDLKQGNTSQIKAELVFDTQNHHYQLLSIGWDKDRFVYTTAFHFSIIAEKVWIQQNNTEALIADELVARGIPTTDIVLAFIPKDARAFAGFAVS